jgi:hypothetical protein
VADRLTVTDVACWVLKSRRSPTEIDAGWIPGTQRTLTRCLRRSYRIELMRAGQPCLLWLSGQREPGVQAIGTLAGEAVPSEQPGDGAPEVAVAVTLTRLLRPVERALLLADHEFAGAEVLRMPAGSNPSYLSPARFGALLELLDPAEAVGAGWPSSR